MSFLRLLYYSAITGGWAAFIGWLLAECFVMEKVGVAGRSGLVLLEVVLVAGCVGAAIGAGLNVVAGLSNFRWQAFVLRMLAGAVIGGVGGALGGLLGNLAFVGLGSALENLLGNKLLVQQITRSLGFVILGVGVGCVDGLYSRSPRKIRNGMIGGAIGGLLGGVLFDPLIAMMQSGSGMSSRATAFVILGVCVGALIGMVQLILRDAWITVEDGYRSGSQVILDQRGITLGRADYLPLPFLGPANANLALEHARITRQTSGQYSVEDNGTPGGTFVNHERITGPQPLQDGDVIKVGSNYIRFNERKRGSESPPSMTDPGTVKPRSAMVAPAPKRKLDPAPPSKKPTDSSAAKPASAGSTNPPKKSPSKPAAKKSGSLLPPPPPPKKKKKR